MGLTCAPEAGLFLSLTVSTCLLSSSHVLMVVDGGHVGGLQCQLRASGLRSRSQAWGGALCTVTQSARGSGAWLPQPRPLASSQWTSSSLSLADWLLPTSARSQYPLPTLCNALWPPA